MSAVRLWVRADLRRRWRSWVVLGVLAGLVVGLAGAAVAGARRTSVVIPKFVSAGHIPDVGVLVNSPDFDAPARAKIAALPQVRDAYPFAVLIATGAPAYPDMQGGLTPVTAAAERVVPFGPLLAGRYPDPNRADEVIVTDAASRAHHFRIGSRFTLVQHLDPSQIPPALLPPHPQDTLRQPVHVVGIFKSPDGEADYMPSPAFYNRHRDGLAAIVNQFVSLHDRRTELAAFERAASRSYGSPINVTDMYAEIGKTGHVITIEERGLLLFALAVLLGGGTLVGQALVRSVTSPGGDIETWRALGSDEVETALALTLPAGVAALTAAMVGAGTVFGLSERFPIGVARQYDLGVGYHLDWTVLVPVVLVAAGAVLALAGAAATLRVARGEREGVRTAGVAAWATRIGLPPVFAIGSRLALEPGRAKRAVPVRSAIIGAIVGVLGVVACFTFRAGISDALSRPERSGTTWDYEAVNGAGTIPAKGLHRIAAIPGVGAVLDARWARTSLVGGRTVPTFGTTEIRGTIPFVMLRGRPPTASDEIALSPAAMRTLHARIGQRLAAGPGGTRRVRVTGEALLPSTSHTEYDEGAWATAPGLARLLPPSQKLGADDIQDFVLIRWEREGSARVPQRRVDRFAGHVGLDVQPAVLPSEIMALGRLRVLPLVLGVFLALLAIATLAHALVTTVRRRRHELAVLRALGFSARQTRGAIAWQATLLAAIGLVVGVPLGVVVGRSIWRWLADSFPFVYEPPLALLAILFVVPLAIVVANLLAAAPSRRAGRIQPAAVLRSE